MGTEHESRASFEREGRATIAGRVVAFCLVPSRLSKVSDQPPCRGLRFQAELNLVELSIECQRCPQELLDGDAMLRLAVL